MDSATYASLRNDSYLRSVRQRNRELDEGPAPRRERSGPDLNRNDLSRMDDATINGHLRTHDLLGKRITVKSGDDKVTAENLSSIEIQRRGRDDLNLIVYSVNGNGKIQRAGEPLTVKGRVTFGIVEKRAEKPIRSPSVSIASTLAEATPPEPVTINEVNFASIDTIEEAFRRFTGRDSVVEVTCGGETQSSYIESLRVGSRPSGNFYIQLEDGRTGEKPLIDLGKVGQTIHVRLGENDEVTRKKELQRAAKESFSREPTIFTAAPYFRFEIGDIKTQLRQKGLFGQEVSITTKTRYYDPQDRGTCRLGDITLDKHGGFFILDHNGHQIVYHDIYGSDMQITIQKVVRE